VPHDGREGVGSGPCWADSGTWQRERPSLLSDVIVTMGSNVELRRAPSRLGVNDRHSACLEQRKARGNQRRRVGQVAFMREL